MLEKIRERGAEMGRRLSVGMTGGGSSAPRRVSVGTLPAGRDRASCPLSFSPNASRKRTSLDCSPGDVSSHLYTAMVGALLAQPAQDVLKVLNFLLYVPLISLCLHRAGAPMDVTVWGFWWNIRDWREDLGAV